MVNPGTLEKQRLAKEYAKRVLYNIKDIMESRGTKQVYLAKLLGMSGGGLSKIMSSDTKLTIEILFQIANILNVTPSSLLPQEEESQESRNTLDEYIDSRIEKKLESRFKQ